MVALTGCQATYENRALERFLKLGSLSRGASQVRLGRRVWHQTEGPFGGQHPRFQDLPQTLPSARDSSNPACQQTGRNHHPQRGDEPSELREEIRGCRNLIECNQDEAEDHQCAQNCLGLGEGSH